MGELFAMGSATAISIIVPTLNEADNILLLVQRIHASVQPLAVPYEIIFVDDHSTDKTVQNIQHCAKEYPVRYVSKVGKRGKAYSLLQGFREARYGMVCMIDADLQCPPEAIAPMYRLLEDYQSDIIITKRVDHQTSFLRRLSSRIFNYLFVKLLFGFDYDTQSGLKLFRKDVLNTITLRPKQWTFDLEFIVRSLEQNYKIVSYDIIFAARHSGTAKLNLLSSTLELIYESIKIRLNASGKKLREGYRLNRYYMHRINNRGAA